MVQTVSPNDVRHKLIQDRGILIRPITETMRLYSVPHETVRSARKILYDQLVRDEGFEVIHELRQAKLEQRYIYRLINLELKYPGMLELIGQVRPQRGKASRLTLKSIGDQYGLTKQRMSQIRQIILEAAKTFGSDEEEIIEDVLRNVEKRLKPKKKKLRKKKRKKGRA